MSKLGIDDYPLSEQRPELIRGRGGKPLSEVTLDGLVGGKVSMEDLCITAEALGYQAQIARAAGRPTLADNFDRAGELVNVPQDFIMQVYELLRPGRARSKAELDGCRGRAAQRLWGQAPGGVHRRSSRSL